MTRRLSYTPLNVEGIQHYGPPDPDNDIMLSLDIDGSPVVRSPAIVTGRRGITTTERKRKGYARSAFERKERRRERRATSAMSKPSSRCRSKKGIHQAKKDDNDKENVGENIAILADTDIGIDSDFEAISSHEEEFSIGNYGNEMDEGDDADSDATQELDDSDSDFGCVTEFHTDEKNDNDDFSSEESEDLDIVQKRHFPSTIKKRRFILDDDDEEVQENAHQDKESDIVEARDDTLRSKPRQRRKENKATISNNVRKIYDHSSDDKAILKGTKKELFSSACVSKNKKISSALVSNRKNVLSTKARTSRLESAPENKKNGKTNPFENKRFSSKNKSDSSGKSVLSKSSSLMNSFVKAAEEALAATEAVMSLAGEDEAATKNSRKKQQQKIRKSTNKKIDDFNFEDEEEDTVVGSDDEASEYLQVQVTKTDNPMRPRRCSSRINKYKDKTDAKPFVEDETGATRMEAPRRRKKSGEIKKKNGRISKRQKLEGEEVCMSIEVNANSSKPHSGTKLKGKTSKDRELGNAEESKETRLVKSKCRSKKTSSSKIDNGNKAKSLDSEDVVASDAGSKVVRPNSRRNRRKKAKSSKINNGKKENEMVVDNDNLSGDEEAGNVTNYNIEDIPYRDDLEVEYHEAEADEDVGTEMDEGFYGSTMLTQAAASQFMEQSFGSSAAEAGRNNPYASGIDEARLRNRKGANKLHSIVMSTRVISKMHPQSLNLEKLVDSSTSDHSQPDEAKDEKSLPGKSEACSLPSKNKHREENKSDKSLESAKYEVHNNSKGNFTTSIELTTRDISNMDVGAFLAAIQTQPHVMMGRSQQSSTVSPETKASVAADSLEDDKSSENDESGESQGDGHTAVDLDEKESAETCTRTAHHGSQTKRIEPSGKMSSEEMAKAMKKMGHHVSEVRKIWKQVSSQFGVSCSGVSTV